MIKDALAKLADRTDLSSQEAETVMLEIMDGAATSAQMAAYLMGLRQKGETVAEVVGSVSAMRSRATRIRVGSPIVVDTCGTGGDAPIRLISPRPRHSWSQGPALPWPNTGIAPCPPDPAARMY